MINQYPEFSESDREQLLVLSHNLLAVLASAAGPEAAENCWNQIADSIHPTLKHDLFMQMLGGRIGREVTLFGLGANVIDAIKVIRQYTGLGLKESKDITDSIRYSGKTVKITIQNQYARSACVRDFEAAGCKVS